MPELIHRDGTVRWRGDDPAEALAATFALGDEAQECTLVGIDSSELPAIEYGSDEAEALPKVKLIRDKPAAEVLIVNEATGEVEQRLEGSGKLTIADPDGGPGDTTEVTPAQLAKISTERALDHAVAAHERALEGHDSSADLAASALAEVHREAQEADESLSPADALARAQERIAEGSAGADPVAAPTELRHEGEPVKLRVSKG